MKSGIPYICFNRTHRDQTDVGYQSGDKIAIKINIFSCSYEWDNSQDNVAIESVLINFLRSKGRWALRTVNNYQFKHKTSVVQKIAKNEKASLSEIIDVLNDRFVIEFEDADKLFFEQIEYPLKKTW